MPEVIVLGAGVCGLAAGMMLARDGHRVTVLERDPSPVPETAQAAWEEWGRDGVRQFRQPHILQARGRQALDTELPDVRRALESAGAFKLEPTARMPPSIADHSPRAGDDRLVTWTARRPTIELVFGQAAEAQPGLEVRRGVSVTGLRARRVDGRLQVEGVRDAKGDGPAADLVVDAMGRRSPLPALLADAGGDPQDEEAEDSGFIYYSRFFRTRDGTSPSRGAPC